MVCSLIIPWKFPGGCTEQPERCNSFNFLRCEYHFDHSGWRNDLFTGNCEVSQTAGLSISLLQQTHTHSGSPLRKGGSGAHGPPMSFMLAYAFKEY